MPEIVRYCNRVGQRELDAALKPIISGDGAADFFKSANVALSRVPNYARLLSDAELVGLDPKSVNAGFIAGLRAGGELLYQHFEFLDEASRSYRLAL